MKPHLEKITKELLWKIIQLDEDVKEDLNSVIIDCLIEIWDTKKPTDYAITDYAIQKTYMDLPFTIILEALQNGFSDTVVRESIYESIQAYKDKKVL